MDEYKRVGNTVYLDNLPISFKKDCIYKLFGVNENHVKMKVCNTSHQVVFKNRKKLTSSLNHITDTYSTNYPFIFSNSECDALLNGYKKTCQNYQNAEVSDKEIEKLSVDINQYMFNYDKVAQKQLEMLQKDLDEKMNLEDGWTVVRSKRSKKHDELANYATNKKKFTKLVPNNKHKKPKENPNFYNYQIKQSQIDHMKELKRKFEEDKARIVDMKAKRRFKPI